MRLLRVRLLRRRLLLWSLRVPTGELNAFLRETDLDVQRNALSKTSPGFVLRCFRYASWMKAKVGKARSSSSNIG